MSCCGNVSAFSIESWVSYAGTVAKTAVSAKVSAFSIESWVSYRINDKKETVHRSFSILYRILGELRNEMPLRF